MVYLSLEKKPGKPLIRQIYEQLRNSILDGTLKAGAKIPSTREMAHELNVSRNTVNEAYELLIAEGFLGGVRGKGVFVEPGAALARKPPEPLSKNAFLAFTSRELAADAVCFHSGTPATDLFPRTLWNKYAFKAFREAPDSAFGYDDPRGRPELRRTLSIYLNQKRGVVSDSENILITTGAKQALSLIARCLLDGGGDAVLEDPSNLNVRKIFAYHTRNILPAPVDQDGLVIPRLPADRTPALVFTTPSHQFPLGGILPIQRRLGLLDYAAEKGCYIVEDDYDSEFRYCGLPVSSMQALDPQRVIYVGTFSKTLFPSLRLGYLVLPDALVERFTTWKALGDHHTNSLNQLTLMRFIESLSLERHIARMKKIYRGRRDCLLACLHDRFGARVTTAGESAGMHLVARFPGIAFSGGLIQQLNEKGVIASTVAEHVLNGSDHADSLILGYAHLPPDRIQEGSRRMAEVIAQ